MSRMLASRCKPQARRIAGTIIALAALAVMYATERTTSGNAERVAAEQFAFSRHSLPEVSGPEIRRFRHNIHPELRHISWYISALGGAAAALNEWSPK
jgi:hypothetical protein